MNLINHNTKDMQVKIISKNFGTQVIDTDNYLLKVRKTDTLYQCVKHIFCEWIEEATEAGAPMAKDIKGMYYGEADQPAIYDSHGAILQAIENLIEEAEVENITVITTKKLLEMDLEAAFY